MAPQSLYSTSHSGGREETKRVCVYGGRYLFLVLLVAWQQNQTKTGITCFPLHSTLSLEIDLPSPFIF